MRSLLKILAFCGLLGLLCGSAFASDIYFAASSAGSNNGISCANAYAYNDGTHGINKSVNWVAGNTLHVCGTISVSAGAGIISAQASGSSGNPITIKFESGAILNAPYFGNGGNAGIYLSGHNYITVNGGNSGASATYPTVPTLWTGGIIENYANGDSGQTNCPGIANTGTGACSNQNLTAHLIEFTGSANIVIENLFMLNQVVTTGSSGNGAPGADCVYFNGSNDTITNNQFSFCGNGVDNTNYGNDSNTVISNNYFTQNGWALGCAGGAVTNSNYQFFGNWLHDFSLYQKTTAHVNGIHCYDGSGGGISSMYVHDNIYDGNMGTAGWTSWNYFESNGAGDNWNNNTGTLYFFNNICIDAVGLGNGCVQTGGGTGNSIYNNVFWGCAPGSGCAGGNPSVCMQWGGTGMNVEGNVFINCSQIAKGDQHSGQTLSYGTWDYNVYGHADNGGNDVIVNVNASGSQIFGTTTLTGWQAQCSCDSHSIATTNTFSGTLSNITSAGIPTSGYVGLKEGANLTSLATGSLADLAQSTNAANSVSSPQARPTGTCSTQGTTSCWDIGAYEISAGFYALTQSLAGSGSVSSSPSGISCPSTCSASYSSGTIVTLTETPSVGYTFTGWSGGGCSGSATTCNVTMSAAQSVTATFTATAGQTVSVTVTGTGSISDSAGAIVNCTSSGGTCSGTVTGGTVDTMTPTDTLGYYLSAWGGACSGNTCAPTITTTTSITATFLASSACISTATIAPPSVAPFSGLTGAGTISYDPEPLSLGNSTSCFHLPILRATDGNTSTTGCTNSGGSCTGQANLTGATDSSDGQDNEWSVDDSQFSAVNTGNNFLIVNFNPTSFTVGTIYNLSVGTGFTWLTQPVYSHTTSQKVYVFGNSAGHGPGPVMSSFPTSGAPPWTRTCVFDFSSTGGAGCGAGTTNGLPVVTGTGTTAGTTGCPASCTLTSTSGTQFPVPVTATVDGVSYSNPIILSTTLMQLPSDPGTHTAVPYSMVWTNNLFASTGQVTTQTAGTGACTQYCVTYASGTNFAGLTSITINGTGYGIAAGNTATVMHLNSPPGANTGLTYILNWFPTDAPSINTTDTSFGDGFGFSGTQNAAAWVCQYVVGSGISCFNSITSQVTGDWGSTGTATCTNCSPLGSFVIHNVKFSPDGKWAFIQQGSGCITTCSFNGDPYEWQVGTLNIQACNADCSGHWGPGFTGWQTEYNTPHYSWQSYASPNSPVIFPSSYCSGVTTPFDAHASWWNGNTADAIPFMTSTTAGTHNPTYSFCTVSELIGVFSPGSISNSGTILRYAHNYGAATSQFAAQNQLMTVSQTGRFASFTSSMSVPGTSTPYLGALGGTTGVYPATSVASSRADVFVVMLDPFPAAMPSFLPVSGTYTGTQSVAISSTSPGAIICYNTTGAPQTNGAAGCASGSTLYSSAVSVSSSETLYAVAGGTGYLDSQIASSAYTINAVAPGIHLLTPGVKLTPGASIGP